MRSVLQIVATCFCAGAALPAWGQSDSPFEPPGSGTPKKISTSPPKISNPVPGTPISNEIEMRGYFKLGDVYYFSIHKTKIDPKSKSKRKKSEWVKEGEEAFGQFRAKGFDPSEETLTIERFGRTEDISLHVSQWGKKPNGKKQTTRRSLPLPRSSTTGKGVMPPRPKMTPVLPPSLGFNRVTPLKPRGTGSSVERASSSRSPSSSLPGGGFSSRPFAPRRGTTPSVSPGSGSETGTSPNARSSERSSSPITGSPTVSPPVSPAVSVPNVSTGDGSTTGEIDLSNLPPPPPPPNILPPGPPPDIEPSVEDR